MKHLNLFLGSVLLTVAMGVNAQNKDERAGSCEDAKQQLDYFCNNDNPNDTMVALGTACTNAKKNKAAACDGVVEEDKSYKFEK
jgi:hypothetical protein